MEADTHTFKLPAAEAHKLDDLQHELETHRNYIKAMRDFVATHHWPLLGIATVAGVALGFFLRERR